MNDRSPRPEELLRMMPFAHGLGIEIDEAAPEKVVGRLPWAAGLCTVSGILHGGALVALADSMAGVCAYLNLAPGRATSTIELKTDFFAAVRSGEVTAVARPLHLGRTVTTLRTDLFTGAPGERRLVGTTTQTQAVIG